NWRRSSTPSISSRPSSATIARRIRSSFSSLTGSTPSLDGGHRRHGWHRPQGALEHRHRLQINELAGRDAEQPPATERGIVVLGNVGQEARAPRVPPVRPGPAFHFERELLVGPSVVEPPAPLRAREIVLPTWFGEPGPLDEGDEERPRVVEE